MNPEWIQGILWLAGLQAEFEAIDVKLDRGKKTCFLWVKKKQRTGICSGCGELSHDIHSSEFIELRDQSAFGLQVTIKIERLTVRCRTCTGYRVEQHWLYRPRRTHTWRFERHISHLCEEMTNAAVGRIEKLHDKTVYLIDKECLEMRMQFQKLPELGPYYSLDEVYFKYYPTWDGRRANSFITNLLCLKNRKIIANAPGRSEKSADICFDFLSPTQKREALAVASDLHDAFHRSIRKNCPNSKIVLDRFHIMQLFNKAMNDFRAHQLQLTNDHDEVQLLRGANKWLLLTREEKLGSVSRKLLNELKQLNERVVEALLVREYMIQFFSSPTVKIAKLNYYKLRKLISEVDIEPFNKFMENLSAYRDRLFNYFEHKISSGVIEALNHKIKVMKAQAYGYRNLRYFQLKTLQRAGFLNSNYAPLPRLQGKSS